MSSKKEVFVVKDKEYAVVRPDPKQSREANLYYNTVFSKSITSGALVRPALRSYMKKQGLWSDEQDKEEERLHSTISALQIKLDKGGIRLSEAKTIAVDIRRARIELRELYAEYNSLDSNTAEAQAETARFNMLVSLCLVYNDTGERVYKSLDDYEQNAVDDVAFTGAKVLAKMLYSLDDDFEKALTENKFLLKYGFVDEKLRPINKEGKLVDWEGRLINEDGRYIDKDGNYVDVNGNPVSKEGSKIVEFSPFLDDNDQPVVIAEDTTPAEPVKDSKPKKGAMVAKEEELTAEK